MVHVSKSFGLPVGYADTGSRSLKAISKKKLNFRRTAVRVSGRIGRRKAVLLAIRACPRQDKIVVAHVSIDRYASNLAQFLCLWN